MLTSKLICRIASLLMILTLTLTWIGPVEAAPPSTSAAALDPSPPSKTVKLIFIHHSTGENWLTDDYGNLGRTLGENNYFVSDTNYGWGPNGIGNSTDIPDWTEWFSSASTPTYMSALYNEIGQHSTYTRTISNPGGKNQIIMFKSCFPNSALGGNPNDPPTANIGLTVGHAKYVYNQILQYFGAHPEKLFIVITAPPLQDGTYAANARAFNQWLMNNWLADNNYTGTNVAIFDFYNVLTGPNNHHRYNSGAIEHIFTPGMNTLYYPSGGDDHPNAVGSQKATSEFVSLLNIFYHRWNESSAPIDITAFSSQSVNDGWILESSENSNLGGTIDAVATKLNLGDDASNKQYRAILSFDTSSLPDTAVITSVTLKFKYAGKTGTLPFSTHGNLIADVRKGPLSNNAALQLGDFKAAVSKNSVLSYTNSMVSNWFSGSFAPANFQYINLTNVTQFRLRFATDDNNDLGADLLKIYSGNAGASSRPKLIIEYYVP